MTQSADDPWVDIIRSARRQHRAGAGSVLDIMLRLPGLDGVVLGEALSGMGGVSVLLDASTAQPDFAEWDVESARTSRCVVVRRSDATSLAAMEDPWDETTARKLHRRLGRRLPPVAVRRDALEAWLARADPGHILTQAAVATRDASTPDGPIVAFVDSAIRAACSGNASDIHFECDRAGVTVKLRLDGVMTRFARLEGIQASREVISRIKVMAQLDITEQRLPQDGRFRHGRERDAVDLRVSIMPSVFGEDAVLRLLDKAQLRTVDTAVSLDALGFADDNAQRIRQLASAPNGMLLVTGPTGSGKTTTVYAVLSEINFGLEKIVTIEDPVEYELPGVLQIPVNERKGLTFARGLRSILRHDPDRILVGEIRDAETAEIAVQSALTGHLVCTTVHANSITDIIGRFRHFGLDMFGFMSALNGVVVQRLMRRVCPHCVGVRASGAAETGWLASHVGTAPDEIPRAVGCAACRQTGYLGRFVIAEVHLVDDVLRDQVIDGAPVSVLRRHADASGVVALSRQAAMAVTTGRTTIEEVRRVVGWP